MNQKKIRKFLYNLNEEKYNRWNFKIQTGITENTKLNK